MDNQLKEFKELPLDNALLKVQNQTLANKNLKWKEWWKIVQKIMEKHIHDNLKLARANEEAYLKELIAYKLKF
jgi:hypothetical protein